MAVPWHQWRKMLSTRSWILGGIGLSMVVWWLDTLTHLLGDWLPAIVVGSGVTWVVLKLQRPETPGVELPENPVTLTTVQTALSAAEGMVDQLATEVQDLTIDGSAQQLSDLRSQIHRIVSELQRDEVRLGVMGGKSVGKTTLTQLLRATWAASVSGNLKIEDTPELFSATEQGEGAEKAAWQLARSVDLILFITTGDLTATELEAIQQIIAMPKRLVLVLNKQDQYLPADQELLLTQLQQRLHGLVNPADVLTISSQPQPLKVRQHQSDHTVKEWFEQPQPQIASLTERLNQILLQEADQLVLSSSLGQVKAVQTEAKSALNQVRRDRVMPRVDQAQWIVAGTAFANPFPALDLLATAAINAQMVMDISNVYQRRFSLEQAKTIAATLAGVMLKLGVVEVSTQAIAGMLKANAVTFMAGGLIQGVSAAYLTRLAGLTLMSYFEGEEGREIQPDRLQQIMQQIFEQNRRLPFLQLFVKQAVDRLMPNASESAPQINTQIPSQVPALPTQNAPPISTEAISSAGKNDRSPTPVTIAAPDQGTPLPTLTIVDASEELELVEVNAPSNAQKPLHQRAISESTDTPPPAT